MTLPQEQRQEAPVSGGATPGPWVLGSPVQEEYGTYRHVSERGYGGDIVARVCVAHTANATLNECGAANANLIVAAPDMYEALDWLVQILPEPHLDNDEFQRVWTTKARAALAKATGKAA